MKIGILLSTSLRSLRRNTLRSLLTALGVIIGVSAVTALVSIGRGAGDSIQREISALGSNLIYVAPGSARAGRSRVGAGTAVSLKAEDAEAIRAECPSVIAVAAMVQSGAALTAEGESWSAPVAGTGPDYLTVRNWGIEAGSMFTDADVRTSAAVCVVGRTVADNLFPDGRDPVGRTIRVRTVPLRVVGVLAAKGKSGFGEDQDDVLLVPLTTAQRRILGTNRVNVIVASAAGEAAMPDAVEEIRGLLRERHGLRDGRPDDFEIGSQADISAALGTITGVMTALLAGIAGISLLVGGIGIMNIMLVSVTERTREIGLRRALGAKRRDVLAQFLTEAVVLSLLGGAIGLALGAGAAAAVAAYLGWPVLIPTEAMVLAFGFSAGIGVFFGWFPACRAARLSPIEALRHE